MKFALSAAGLAALVASSASAGITIGDTLSLSRAGTSPQRAVTVNFDYSRASNATGVTGGVVGNAGVTTFDVLQINGSTGYGQILGFCVEINEGFPDDPISYNVVDPTSVPEESPPGNMSANQSQMMQDLFRRYYNSTVNRNGASWSDYSNNAAAFQLVVWEISHENFSSSDLAGMQAELNIDEGAFVVTDATNGDSAAASTVASIAGSMIAALGGGGWQSYASLLGATNGSSGSVDNQDFLFVVPSPAIAGLAGLGLVGMRRRRR